MKPVRRQRRGFERAGEIPLVELGVSSRKVQDLSLARAWTDAAGPALAAQATVEARRGVLEVAAVDAVWARTFVPILERLAARVAAACPELRLSRYRLTVEGVASAVAAETIPVESPAPGPAPRRARSRPAQPGTPPTGAVDEQRLRRLARRYAERQKP